MPPKDEKPKYRFPTPDSQYVQAFVQSVAAGKRFTHTETLFGGTVVATFRELTAAEEDAIRVRAVADMRANGGLTAPNAMELLEQQTSWRMGASLAALRIGGALYEAKPLGTAPSAADYGELHKVIIAKCEHDAVYGALRAAYVRFGNLLGGIEERASDPNFFAATGSGGPSPASPSATA